jgi:hypothetical protein
MRHPPELLIYLVPLAMIVGVAAAIGVRFQNPVAWGMAIATAVLCFLPLVSAFLYVIETIRLRSSVLASENWTRVPKRSSGVAFVGIWGILTQRHLLDEEITRRNAKRYLSTMWRETPC